MSENIKNITEPRLVEMFSDEVETKLKNDGLVYRRKIKPIVNAEEVTQTINVYTILPDGTKESSVEAKPTDWIITGPKGERFVFTKTKFDELYIKDDLDGYIPRERKIIALKNPFNTNIRISAPWGTSEKPAYQDGSEKCFLIVGLDENGNKTKDRYLIGDEELLIANYEIDK
jgi:hypothetical protein